MRPRGSILPSLRGAAIWPPNKPLRPMGAASSWRGKEMKRGLGRIGRGQAPSRQADWMVASMDQIRPAIHRTEGDQVIIEGTRAPDQSISSVRRKA